jgi:MFS family permease
MLAGILMAGAALIGLSTVSSLAGFYVFYLFNALGYVCGGPLPNQVLLSRWFDKSRGKAMGFAYLGIGIGGAVVPLASHRLTEAFGWHAALRTLGIAIIAIALPMAFFIKDSAEAQRPKSARASIEPAPVTETLKSARFYLLAVASSCSIAAVGGTNQNLKLYLSLDQNYTQGEIAKVASLVLASSLAGRLLMGWLADRYPRKYVMLLIYGIVAISIPVLLLASTPAALYLFAVIFGIGLGGDYMIVPLIAGDLFGVRMLGRVLGIILAADGMAEAVSPMLVAKMRDSSNSYTPGFTMLIIIAAVGALAAALLPASRRRAALDLSPVKESEPEAAK